MPIPERVPGAIVDVARVQAERARCSRFVFYTLPPRTRPARAQAACPPRPGPPSCPTCCVAMAVKSCGEVRCGICGRTNH